MPWSFWLFIIKTSYTFQLKTQIYKLSYGDIQGLDLI